MLYAVGVDIGGTNLKVGVVDRDGQIISRAKAKTKVPARAAELSSDLWMLIQQALEKKKISLSQVSRIGVGCPGTVEPTEGILQYACNLELANARLGDLLEDVSGKSVFLENDANCALLGEVKLGAARGAKNAVMLTLGTGIGSGILVDGKIYSGFNCFGGEIGHMVIVSGGALCSCGRKGCFERYASASALVRMTREAMERDRSTVLWEISDGDLEKVSGITVFEGQKRGDLRAQEILNRYVQYLADGVTNVINILQPEVLVIGGGLGSQGEELLNPLRKLVDAQVYSKGAKAQTQIVSSQLGNDAGIIGAAFLGAE